MLLPAVALSLATAFSALAVADAPAARVAGPWDPFIGCWSAAEGTPTADVAVTCIVAVEGEPLSVDLVVSANGVESSRSRIRADGTMESTTMQGCTTRESARFSLDGARVFLQGEVTCDDERTQRIASIFSLTVDGGLLHVRGRDDDRDPQVVYRLLTAVTEEGAGSNELRDAVAGHSLDADAITEAAQSLPPAVTEIWLAAMVVHGSAIPEMNAEMRSALRDAGVQRRVVALLDAFADPDGYNVAFSSAGAVTTPVSRVSSGNAGAAVTSYDRTSPRSSCSAEIDRLAGARDHAAGQRRSPPLLIINAWCDGHADLNTMMAAYAAYGGMSLDRQPRDPAPAPARGRPQIVPEPEVKPAEAARPARPAAAPAPAPVRRPPTP